MSFVGHRQIVPDEKIFVKTLDRQIFYIYVQKQEKIIDLKIKISIKIGLAANDQRLIFQGIILYDDKMVDEYPIMDGTVINVIDRLRGGMQISVKTLCGKTISLEVLKTEKIMHLKKKIEEKTGLAPDDQKLIFQGGILEDHKTINEYLIVDQSVINVIERVRGPMQIFFKTMDGKIGALGVYRKETVAGLKLKIQEKIGLTSDEQKLLCQGRIICDPYQTIDEYQITENSIINVIPKWRPGYEIFVKTTDGKSMGFNVEKIERIKDLKKKIQEKIEVAADHQKLVFQGEILEDDRAISEYGIEEKSIIFVIVRLRGLLSIFAKIRHGKTVVIKVQKTQKIRDIKKQIQKKIGVAPEEQKLIFLEKILEDDKMIDDYPLEEKSVINVYFVLRKIVVKTLNGTTFDLNVLKTQKIIDIKKRIKEKIGFAIEEQILTFHDYVLEDNRYIDECGLLEESVIEIYTKLNKSEMVLFVHTIDGKFYEVKVFKSDKIIDIKKQIEIQIGVILEEQTLIYKGFVLDDDRIVAEYGMIEKSEILLRTKLKFDMKICVKINESRIISIDTNKFEQVSSLKRKIQSETALASENQLLIFNKLILEDDKTVEDYKVASGSKFHVVAD